MVRVMWLLQTTINNNAQPGVPVLRNIAEILDVDVRELLISTKN